MQKAKHVGERKAVLIRKRDVDAFIGGRRLQFEIERTAKPLSQSKPPGTVQPAAERRVNYELHPAALIEKSLGDDDGLRGHSSEHGAPGDDVLDGLLRARAIEPAFTLEKINRVRSAWTISQRRVIGDTLRQVGDFLSQLGHLLGQLARARRRFAAPEGDIRRRTLRVFDKDPARLDAADAPGSVSEEHDVATKALDREIFVHRTDVRAIRLGDHGVK